VHGEARRDSWQPLAIYPGQPLLRPRNLSARNLLAKNIHRQTYPNNLQRRHGFGMIARSS